MGGPRHRRGPRPPVRPEPGVRRARERLVTTWSLVTVVADGEPFVAARLGDGSLREVPALKQWSSLAELVDDWPAAAEAVRAIDVEAADPVVGVGGRDVPPERALAHVAGYCVSNDITARGYHRRASAPAPPFDYDWFASKARDGSLPLGPGLTPAWFVPDPQDLRIRLWVNDELQQDASTADMICDIPRLLAAASRTVTLEPGDVITTGTPAGV